MATSTSSVVTSEETWQSAGAGTWISAAYGAFSWRDHTHMLHTVDVTDSLRLVESLKKQITLKKSDAFGLADGNTLQKTIGKVAHSFLSLVETREVSMWQMLRESLVMAEAILKGFHGQQGESFALDDGDLAKKQIGQNSAESLVLGDGNARAVEFWQSLSESLAVVDTESKRFSRPLSESFAMEGNHLVNEISVNAKQALGISELTARSVSAQRSERLSLVDQQAFTAISSQAEAFRLAESFVKGFGKNSVEVMAFVEAFDRVSSFVRKFAEKVAISDAPAKLFSKREFQSFGLVSEMIVPATMVIGDMLIESLGSTGDVTMDDFVLSMDSGAVPGWTPWRTFLPGDYEYSKAMFRVVMDSISADRGSVEFCQVAVDVPDVNDHGSGRVLDAQEGVYVEFSREYHVIPEITLTARGGTGSPTAAELLGAPTLLGFTARLRDTMTGEYMTGSFTWAANGY